MNGMILITGLCLLPLSRGQAKDIPIALGGSELPKSGCAMASAWVRANNAESENTLVHLSVIEKTGGKTKSRILNYTRATQKDWSRISCWLSPAMDGTEREGLSISAPQGAEISIDKASVATVPESMPPFDKGFIRVDGPKLLNDKEELVFVGVNMTAYSDDYKNETGPILGFCCEEDYQEIASFGFNAVRLACWHQALMQPGGFDWLRLQISFARKYGLYVILDMHAPPGGCQNPEYKGKFWNDAKGGAPLRDDLVAFWCKAAALLKGEPAIAAYDLLNEPLPKKDSQWHAYARVLVEAIRSQGAKQPIVVETSMLDDAKWPELDDKSVIYDTHWYTPWEFVAQSEKKPFGKYETELMIGGQKVVLNRDWLKSQLNEYASWCRQRNVPMQIGEYGVNLYAQSPEVGGLHWLLDMVSIFGEARVSRFYWSWYPFDMGLHNGWFRRAPGVFCAEAARIAGGRVP